MTSRAKRCRHPRDARRVGPRLKALYGSWATEVCEQCGSWRYQRGWCKGDKRWRDPAEMVCKLVHDHDADWS